MEQKREEFKAKEDEKQAELAEIDRCYDTNKEKVINMLLESVMNVQLDVPRVVKLKIKPAVEDEEWDD